MILEIEGVGRVEVDDAFRELSAEEQQRTVEEIKAEAGGQQGADSDIEREAQALAAQTTEALGEPGAGHRFQDAFTFGLGDEMAGVAGGIGGLFKGDPVRGFQVARRAEQIRNEQAAQNAGTLGSVASGLGAVGTGALARAPAAATAIGRMGQAAKEGAALGALHGGGQAEGSVSDALGGAAMGGAVGGVAGPVASGAFDLGRQAVRAGRGIGRAVGRLGQEPQERAAGKVAEALQADDVPLEQAAARMRRGGDDGVRLGLLDVADENVQGLGRAAAAVPGKGRRQMNRFLDERKAGQAERIQGAAAEGLGDPQAFRQAGEEIAARRAAGGNRLYTAAFEEAQGQPVNTEGLLREIDNRLPSARGGIKTALERARSLLTRKGTMGEMPEADLRSLHEAKMALDDMLSAGPDSSMGKVARGEIAKVRRELLKVMDEASPTYQAARQQYADESSLLDALEAGRRFLREDVDTLPDMLATMGQAERDMFRLGAVREIRRQIERAPDAADMVKRVFGSEEKRKALRAVFPNAKQFREFQSTVMREAKAQRSHSFVRQGSRTAFVDAEKDAMSGAGEALGAAADVSAGAPLNTTMRMLAKVFRDRSNMDPEVAEEVARILTMTDPDQAMRLLSRPAQKAVRYRPDPRVTAAGRLGAVGGAAELGSIVAP